jgi:hypothetical protein
VKRGLARDVRVRVHRRLVLCVPRGSRVCVTFDGELLALSLYANGALRASKPPRGWALEFGHRIAGAREVAAGELWIAITAPRGARVTFEALPRRKD